MAKEGIRKNAAIDDVTVHRWTPVTSGHSERRHAESLFVPPASAVRGIQSPQSARDLAIPALSVASTAPGGRQLETTGEVAAETRHVSGACVGNSDGRGPFLGMTNLDLKKSSSVERKRR